LAQKGSISGCTVGTNHNLPHKRITQRYIDANYTSPHPHQCVQRPHWCIGFWRQGRVAFGQGVHFSVMSEFGWSRQRPGCELGLLHCPTAIRVDGVEHRLGLRVRHPEAELLHRPHELDEGEAHQYMCCLMKKKKKRVSEASSMVTLDMFVSEAIKRNEHKMIEHQNRNTNVSNN
jgi:hypothetical protein